MPIKNAPIVRPIPSPLKNQMNGAPFQVNNISPAVGVDHFYVIKHLAPRKWLAIREKMTAVIKEWCRNFPGNLANSVFEKKMILSNGKF